MARRRRSTRSITWLVHPGCEAWVPGPADVQAIARSIRRSVEIQIWPRSMVESVWNDAHPGRVYPRDWTHYQFRAWANKKQGKTVIFVDESETPLSVLWLILHELCHLDLLGSRLLDAALDSLPRARDYHTSDSSHEKDLEERLCNFTATRQLQILGYPAWKLNRTWWRNRLWKMGIVVHLNRREERALLAQA